MWPPSRSARNSGEALPTITAPVKSSVASSSCAMVKMPLQVIENVKKRLEAAQIGASRRGSIKSVYDRSASDSAGRGQPEKNPHRRKSHRGIGLYRFSAPFPQCTCGHFYLAGGGADQFYHHGTAGNQRQYHELGRDCHCCRRHGGRGHRHDRKRPQAYRTRRRQKTPLGIDQQMPPRRWARPCSFRC